MATQPWFDDVRRRLAKRGLPPEYVKRFVDELSDHFQDIEEENMGKEADVSCRLGESEQVAEAAVVAYRRRSFLGRHPLAAIAVFGVSPIVPLLFLGYVSEGILVLANAQFHFYPPFCSNDASSVAMALWPLILAVFMAVPLIVTSLLYCELAQWSGIGRKWMFMSCAVLAMIGARFNCENGIPWWDFGFHTPAQWCQFIAPLAASWWFMRKGRDQNHPAAAFLAFAVAPATSLMVFIGVAVAGLWAVGGWDKIDPLNKVLYCLALGNSGYAWQVGACLVLLAVVVTPAGLLSILFCKLGKRLSAGKKWIGTSCTILAVMAVLPGYYLPFWVGPSPQSATLRTGLCHIQQVGEFLVPLAIGWWFLRRGRNHSGMQIAT